jgi:hypothetical protein
MGMELITGSLPGRQTDADEMETVLLTHAPSPAPQLMVHVDEGGSSASEFTEPM